MANHAFLYADDRALPFSNHTFQRLVADVHGCNCEIRAPVIAFIAFQLSRLLEADSWNVLGHRAGKKSQDSGGGGYLEFLNLAVASRGTTIASIPPTSGEGGSGSTEMWIRIAHDLEVCVRNAT